MRWKTRITERFGIRVPIVQGALARIGTVDLAAAVSEAGALGMITAWTLRSPEKLRREIRRFRSLSDRPFAVNLSPTMDPRLLEMLEVVIEEKVPVVETAGSRSTEYGRRIREAGLTWMHKVQTVRHALAAERDGADVIAIMGLEGAGLKSPVALTTLVTVALASRSVRVPLVAAGGIGDARTFLGALALGADAVMMGSVFCAVLECPLGESRKKTLVEADPYDPLWRNAILATPSAEDLRKMTTMIDTREIKNAAGKAEDFGFPKSIGTGTISLAIGFIDQVMPAKECIERIVHEAEEILRTEGIGGWKLHPDDRA
jgi:NADH:quinone reductase (non-electrogenic)